MRHGRPDEAVEPLQRAIALRDGGPDPDRVAELRYGVAQALRDSAPKAARTQAQTAADAYRSLGDTAMADEIDAWLRDF